MLRTRLALLTISLTFSCLAVTGLSALPVYAQNSLKTIDNPGGGQIVYGPLSGVTSMSESMGFMLRMVHGHFGDRPVVGKFFKAQGSDSIATFFTLTAKTQGNQKIAGMVIVTMPQGAKPAAALLYDDADRFAKTANPMLKKLGASWHPGGTKPTKSSASAGPIGVPTKDAPVQALHTTNFADGSGTIGLPTGWHLTDSGSGTVGAEGPKGDSIHLGTIVNNIYDPRYPQSQQMIQYMSRSNNPFYVCRFEGDLVGLYKTVLAQDRQRRHKPMPTLEIISTNPLPAGPYEVASTLVMAHVDEQDGKGPQLASLRIGVMKPVTRGQWAMTLSTVGAPTAVADNEWPTLQAMANSWRQNGAVIQAQTNVVIDNIHRIGAAADARNKATQAANDAHNAAFDKHMDDLDRYSKNFQDYQMDRVVIQDNDRSEHGTVSQPVRRRARQSQPQPLSVRQLARFPARRRLLNGGGKDFFITYGQSATTTKTIRSTIRSRTPGRITALSARHR